MTRKHFIELAEMLYTMNASTELINQMANFCAKQNRNFDRQRFLAACEGEEYVEPHICRLANGDPRRVVRNATR